MVSLAGNLGAEQRTGNIVTGMWDDQTPGRKRQIRKYSREVAHDNGGAGLTIRVSLGRPFLCFIRLDQVTAGCGAIMAFIGLELESLKFKICLTSDKPGPKSTMRDPLSVDID
jgi:hypothetical protein